MNKELLFQLYAIHSESGNEKKMRRFLRKQARECGATSVETDKHGNLLIIKGEADTYPCLAAHMDQVQHNHSKDFSVVEIDGDVLGWSPKCHEQQGLGADDKNGIFICLELLRRTDCIKVAFFVGEEVGCTGSRKVDLGFFKDCRFIIEPDRKGSSDLITNMFCGPVCSEAFIDAIGYREYGYRIDHGTVTDVGELVERGVGISCLNLSCGYYNAHSDREITVLPHLQNCLDFVEHVVNTCTDVYPFEYEPVAYAYGLYDTHRLSGKSSYGYGYFGSKKYDAHEESMYRSGSDFYDGEEYYDGGYYDLDCDMMEEYLSTMPELTFDMIKADYLECFYASQFFSREQAVDELHGIYGCVLDVKNEKEWWKTADDNDTIGELSFDDVTPIRKVS